MTDAVSVDAISFARSAFFRRFSLSLATITRFLDLYSACEILPSASSRLLYWTCSLNLDGDDTVSCTVWRTLE